MKKTFYAVMELGYLVEIQEKEYEYIKDRLDQDHPDYVYEEYEVDDVAHAKIKVNGKSVLYWVELNND